MAQRGAKRHLHKDWDIATDKNNVSQQVLICASIIAANAQAVREASWQLVGAIFVLHAGGFALGYFAARMIGIGVRQSMTISIEVGMYVSQRAPSITTQMTE